MSDRNNAVPGLFTILNQVVDGLATRLQIASIELSVASSRGTGFPAPLSQHPSCGTAMGASLTNLHKAERVQA